MDGIVTAKWLFCILAVLSVISPLLIPQATFYLLMANTLLLSAIYIHSDRMLYTISGEAKFDTMWKTKAIVVIAVFGLLAFGILYNLPSEILINAINLMLSVLGYNATQSAHAMKE